MKKEPSYPIRATTKGRVVLGILAAGALGGAAAEDLASNAAAINKDRVTAVATAKSVLGKVVVLKAGANYRLSPDAEDPTQGNPNNLAGTVPDGKELVVKLPLVSTPPTVYTADQSGWIGFTMPGTDTSSIHSKTDRAKSTVWADLSILEAEGLATELPYGNLPEGSEISPDVPATVSDDGSIRITGSIEDGPLFAYRPSGQPVIVEQHASYKNLLDLYSGTNTGDTIAVSAFEQAGGYEQLQASGIPTTK